MLSILLASLSFGEEYGYDGAHMITHLEDNIYTNGTHYFFTLLGPRFDAVVELYRQELSRRLGVLVKPIFVLNAIPCTHFEKENYIILNAKGEQESRDRNRPVIDLPEYEDLNAEFLQSKKVQAIADQLLQKQDTVYVHSTTSSFFAHDARYTLLGPDPQVSKKYDAKTTQHDLFVRLGLSYVPAETVSNRADLSARPYPYYLSAAYTSGGNESGPVENESSREALLSAMRDVNVQGPFLVSEIITDIIAEPNTTAMVIDHDKTVVTTISDQIMRGKRYLGNAYPTAIDQMQQQEVIAMTEAIGNALSGEGFRGMFGCDFLITKDGRVMVVDLNPRRQGGYACVVLFAQEVGVDLVKTEIECALDGAATLPTNYADMQYDHAWVHSKIKPNQQGDQKHDVMHGDIVDAFTQGSGEYFATFYDTSAMFLDGYTGYAVCVGEDREVLLKRLTQITKKYSAVTLDE